MEKGGLRKKGRGGVRQANNTPNTPNTAFYNLNSRTTIELVNASIIFHPLFIHCPHFLEFRTQNSSLTSIRVPQGTAHRCVVFETLTLFYMHEFHVYLTIHALVGVTTRDESNIDVTPLPREDVTHVLPSPPFPSLWSTWGTAFVIHALEYPLFVIPVTVR